MTAERQIEFGDFQTPLSLASEVCKVLLAEGVNPSTVIEPTCGKGSFVMASLSSFYNIDTLFANELNKEYLDELSEQLADVKGNVRLTNKDFFLVDWKETLEGTEEPVLFIGNPPWVTNSKIGSLKGKNLPPKTNFQGMKGFDALTGSSNFDISEWMLIAMANALRGKDGYIAMLVKTSVARKVLSYFWKARLELANSKIYPINSASHFGISADACLLFCSFRRGFATNFNTTVHTALDTSSSHRMIGYKDGHLVADVESYSRIPRQVMGDHLFTWRSGIKHDSGKLMELKLRNGKFINGYEEVVDIETTFVYPMLKSSDLANNRKPARWMIVTQKRVGDDTTIIKSLAPKTWDYLLRNADKLDQRKSSIYKNSIRFSIFGVGDYTFANWKVAVSGLYKGAKFQVIGPSDGKPVVFDDTCYFLSCTNKEHAETIADYLNRGGGRDFINAFTFWDAKRPITAKLLNKIYMPNLATR